MSQVNSDKGSNVSARLRDWRSSNGMTTQQMAEMTDIPKRTLESYMLKSNAALPGIDALKRLSLGLGVSLDWLVFGASKVGVDVALLSRVSVRAAVLPVLQAIEKEYRRGSANSFETGTIFGLTPEELAVEVCTDAADRARKIASAGARQDTLDTVERAMNSRDKT